MENFHLHGIPFRLHSRDLISHYIRQSGNFYEIETFELFKSFIPSEGIFLDIGANIGNHTLMFALNYPKSVIYSFEPARINFELLDFNTKILSNVGIFKIALGSDNSIVHMNYEDIDNKGHIRVDTFGEKVPVMKLDSLKLFPVTFIKIDVEGHEYSVIEGAKETIDRDKPVIWIEDFSQDTINYLINDFGYEIKAKGPFYNYLLVSKKP